MLVNMLFERIAEVSKGDTCSNCISGILTCYRYLSECLTDRLIVSVSCASSGRLVLMPDFSLPLEYYLIPFLIIVGICLILIVVFMVASL